MVVTVHLDTILQRQTPDGWQKQLEVTLLSGSTLADLIPDLGIDMPVSAVRMRVNGQSVTADHVLRDGDQVHLLPDG